MSKKTYTLAQAQAIFTKANKIYKIKNDIDLGGSTLTLPAGCTLDFQGGVIMNGTLVGNGTKIAANSIKIFEALVLSGVFYNKSLKTSWFGAVPNQTDSSAFIQSALDNAVSSNINSVLVERGTYNLASSLNVGVSGIRFGGENSTFSDHSLNTSVKFVPTHSEPAIIIGDGTNTVFAVALHDFSVSRDYTGVDGSDGIYINCGACLNSTFESLYLKGCRIGVHIKLNSDNGFIYNKFTNCSAQYNAVGIAIVGADDCNPCVNYNQFFRCKAGSNYITGLKISTTGTVETILLEGCSFENNGNDYSLAEYLSQGCSGLYLKGIEGVVTINGCYIEGNRAKRAGYDPAEGETQYGNYVEPSSLSDLEGNIVTDGVSIEGSGNWFAVAHVNISVVSSASITLTGNWYHSYRFSEKTRAEIVTICSNASECNMSIHEPKVFRRIDSGYGFKSTSNVRNVFRNSSADIVIGGIPATRFNKNVLEAGTNIFIDPVNGNNSYFGLSPNTARKTSPITTGAVAPWISGKYNIHLMIRGTDTEIAGTSISGTSLFGSDVTVYVHNMTDGFIGYGSPRFILTSPLYVYDGILRLSTCNIVVNCTNGVMAAMSNGSLYFAHQSSITLRDALFLIQCNKSQGSNGLSKNTLVMENMTLQKESESTTIRGFATIPPEFAELGFSYTDLTDNIGVVTDFRTNYHHGTQAERPTISASGVGFQYYDTTLGKYICWNGTAWVNMDGTSLSTTTAN